VKMSDPSATIELSKAWMSEELTMRPLSEEPKDLDSPVRQFLGRRFIQGPPEVQRRYPDGPGAPGTCVLVPGASGRGASGAGLLWR
jgi:hypothetical protein